MPNFLLRGPPRQEGATHDECFPRQPRHSQSLLATSMQRQTGIVCKARLTMDAETSCPPQQT
ncbi:hypothetical protein BN1708_011380 [Verticillium longisporum]|uniref:Uncharacterized protein n=1 Tax=Verticillium longisporum TaxID=100787 RepID=A0A0G4L0F7_VERLO|nr:hypothetical protein BN1708_011380 [Verticillium longisporum]